MKKILMFISLLLGFAGSSFADDSFSVDNITLPQNGEADVVVRFSLDEGSTCQGYVFWLQLPEELEFLTDGTDVIYTVGDSYNGATEIATNIDEGYLKVVWTSTTGKVLKNQSGTLASFKVKPTGTPDVGSTFNCTLTNATISKDKGTVHNVANATFTVTIDEPEDGRIKFDEDATVLPNYTAGQSGDVTMKRTIKGGEWSTIVLPFTLTKAKAEAAFGSDAVYYKFSGYEATVDLDNLIPTAIQLNFSEHKLSTALSSIGGGIPYLIKTSKDITEIRADQVKLVAAVSPSSVTDANYPEILSGKFSGTFVKTKVPNKGMFISGNQFWYSTGETNIKAFRGWFDLDAVLDETISLSRITMNFIDEATAINETIRNADSGKYFDLQGRGVKPTKKGLYIKDGKKVVIK